jgi:hypothetical protein
MPSDPGPREPVIVDWHAVTKPLLAQGIAQRWPPTPGRPRLIGVDGRSGSGKTTTAAMLAHHLRKTTIVSTDDLAWHESFFGWDDMLTQHVLQPLARGLDVAYRPPAWDRRGRLGQIAVPGDGDYVVIEGCGVGRRSLAPHLDLLVWVQADLAVAETRGVVRDGGTDAAQRFWNEWQAEEGPFFAAERPWERAALMLDGTPPDRPVGTVRIAWGSAPSD